MDNPFFVSVLDNFGSFPRRKLSRLIPSRTVPAILPLQGRLFWIFPASRAFNFCWTINSICSSNEPSSEIFFACCCSTILVKSVIILWTVSISVRLGVGEREGALQLDNRVQESLREESISPRPGVVISPECLCSDRGSIALEADNWNVGGGTGLEALV